MRHINILFLVVFIFRSALCNKDVDLCIEKDYASTGFVSYAGTLIDDIDVLKRKFVQGMQVTAINYCLGELDRELLSVQVVMSKQV